MTNIIREPKSAGEWYWLFHLGPQPIDKILRGLPKGVNLYLRRKRQGIPYREGVLSFKSKGRTGAGARRELERLYHLYGSVIKVAI